MLDNARYQVRWVLRFFPKPPRESVAKAALRELVVAGTPRENITYDPGAFQLVIGEQRLWLGTCTPSASAPGPGSAGVR